LSFKGLIVRLAQHLSINALHALIVFSPFLYKVEIVSHNLLGKDKKSKLLISSKLHLVDLAGSERVSKSQAHGSVLIEAKYINLSLSYLEYVSIIQLVY